jgi:hypothetical protein
LTVGMGPKYGKGTSHRRAGGGRLYSVLYTSVIASSPCRALSRAEDEPATAVVCGAGCGAGCPRPAAGARSVVHCAARRARAPRHPAPPRRVGHAWAHARAVGSGPEPFGDPVWSSSPKYLHSIYYNDLFYLRPQYSTTVVSRKLELWKGSDRERECHPPTRVRAMCASRWPAHLACSLCCLYDLDCSIDRATARGLANVLASVCPVCT